MPAAARVRFKFPISFGRQFIRVAAGTVLALICFARPVMCQENGISVGQPKVYDNESLTIMIDQLNDRLAQINTVDSSPLLKALGYTQGSQESDVQRSFTFAVSPTPVVPPSVPSDTGTAAPTSAAQPDAASTASDASKKGNSSNPPSNTSALPALLAAPSYHPDYGESSVDLLSDQVDLSYQIFNLRMILERSITDRLLDGKPRRQMIIGFNISLDPPRNAQDAAAYVELTVNTASGKPVSLVAAMPQEKTYNATSLSSSSTAFGGSAVAKIVSVNYNQRKSRQTFFLYRDCDTLALERAPVGNSVTFGWVFRPVLGRRAVSSGMRQMFAVIALPDTDVMTEAGSGAAKQDEASATNATPQISVRAKTYWLHYDKNTSTTVRTPGYWDWSAKNLPKGEDHTLDSLATLPTETVENSLKPHISRVEAFETTDGNTVLQIEGWNFYSGTSVTIGDKTFKSTQDGLFLKSSQTMVLTASTDILSRSLHAVVNGRYGPSVPLYPQAPERGIVIAQSSISPMGPSYSKIQLILGDADTSKDLTAKDVDQFLPAVLTLNGKAVPYTPVLQETHANLFDPKTSHTYLIADVQVPNTLLDGSHNRAGIIFPLLGKSWAPEDLIYNSDEVEVTKMASGSSTTFLISRPGLAFDGKWKIVLDKVYPLSDSEPPAAPIKQPIANKKGGAAGRARNLGSKDQPPTTVQFYPVVPCPQCYMLKLVADNKLLGDYQSIVLISSGGHAQILSMPTTKAPAKEPVAVPVKITSVSPSSVGLNEVVTVTVAGSGLDAVKQVTFEGKPLTFWMMPEKKPADAAKPDSTLETASSKTSQIQVLLTRDVTGKEGRQDLLVQVDAKNLATVTLTVAAAPTAVKGQSNKTRSAP